MRISKYMGIIGPVLLIVAGLLWLVTGIADLGSETDSIQMGLGLLFIIVGVNNLGDNLTREIDQGHEAVQTIQIEYLRARVVDLEAEMSNMKKRTSLLG